MPVAALRDLHRSRVSNPHMAEETEETAAAPKPTEPDRSEPSEERKAELCAAYREQQTRRAIACGFVRWVSWSGTSPCATGQQTCFFPLAWHAQT
jgi:hypothetical protein